MAFKKQWATVGKKELWTPAEQPFTIGAWFDCADTDTFTYATGNYVQRMDDKFENDNYISAFISEPLANVRSLNGLNVLDFQVNARMQRAGRDIGTSGNQIAIGVFTTDVLDNTSDSYFSFNSAANNDYQLEANKTTYFQGDLNNYGQNILMADADHGAWAIWCVVWDYVTTGTKKLYYNGELQGTVSDYTAAKLDQSQEHILMANRNGSQQVDGASAEWIWGEDDISDTYRQKAEGYMAWKWGIESQLPVGHPYKNAAPTI